MGQLKQLPDVLTKNSASRKSAVTMRGSTVRRTKIDDPTLHLQSITRRVGLPAGIRKRARSIFRHLLTIKSTSCCQNCAAYNYSILHLKTNTDIYQFFCCLVGLSNAKSVQNTSIYATQEDTEICSVLSNMWAKYTANSGSFFHFLKSASTFRCFDPTFAPRYQKMQATCTTLICYRHHISYTHQLGDETSP